MWAIRTGLLACRVRTQVAFESTAGLPRKIPVTGSDVLAYSCAAARELHPLPNLRLCGRRCANQSFERAEKMCSGNLIGMRREVNVRRRFILTGEDTGKAFFLGCQRT
jgi:hypothetical protein